MTAERGAGAGRRVRGRSPGTFGRANRDYVRRVVAGAVAAGLAVALAGCSGGAMRRTDGDAAGPARLITFDSCQQALRDLKHNAEPYVGPYGFQFGGASRGLRSGAEGDTADAPAAVAGKEAGRAPGSADNHSGTNNHEAGVDEPDLVKTDGRRVVSVVDDVLRVVDVASRRQTGTLPLPRGSAQLLVHGDRALVVMRGYRGPEGAAAGDPAGPVNGATLLLVDLAGTPREISRMTLDGEYVDARMVGGKVRLVTRSAPRIGFERPGYDAEPGGGLAPGDAVDRNRATLAQSRIDDWLPRYRIVSGGSVTTGRVGCERLRHPAAYSGTSMLTVTAIDLTASALTGKRAITIVADGRTVYGTGEHLYVANDRRRVVPYRAEPAGIAPTAPPRRPKPRTEIYRFDVSGGGVPRYAASGVVSGWLLNQYAMSEYDGHLRVATTTGSWSGARKSSSAVHVLEPHGQRLRTVGRVGGLGKGERIYAVRYVGPTGYVVTFRQVDPLYVIDLRDPRRPKVVGELKITGYSAYLHPAGAHRLIGVGQAATETGQRLGTQVSLFDVANPSRPRRIANHRLGSSSSSVEFEPHAFLYWPKTGLLVIPVHRYGREGTRGQGSIGLVLRVTRDGLTELGTVSHPVGKVRDYRAAVQRSMVIDGTLWTLSRAGLAVHDTETLDRRSWIPFQ